MLTKYKAKKGLDSDSETSSFSEQDAILEQTMEEAVHE